MSISKKITVSNIVFRMISENRGEFIMFILALFVSGVTLSSYVLFVSAASSLISTCIFGLFALAISIPIAIFGLSFPLKIFISTKNALYPRASHLLFDRCVLSMITSALITLALTIAANKLNIDHPGIIVVIISVIITTSNLLRGARDVINNFMAGIAIQ